jgi:hypothetical protein
MEIASPLNGGAGFPGKSGRKTANACDANPMDTTINTAAHFMSAALSKIRRHSKQNFFAITVIKQKTARVGITEMLRRFMSLLGFLPFNVRRRF